MFPSVHFNTRPDNSYPINPSVPTSSTRRQHQFPTLSIQLLATDALESSLLPPQSKSTITDSLSSLLNTCERIRASCWVVLSVIVDTLYLRLRGLVNDTDRSRTDGLFPRFQTVSAVRASQKLTQRLDFERLICNASFKSLNKLRDIARVEISKVERLQGRARLDPQVFRDVKYINDVVLGTLERMGPRYRTAYNREITVGSGRTRRNYDAITATKDVADFAKRLRDGRVTGLRAESMYGTYRRKWNDFSTAVHETLGRRAPQFDEGGKARLLQEVRKLKGWQGVNEFACWAVTHMAMLNVMGYGKVKSVYRACYDYKVDDRREWVLPGWVVRYMGVKRKDDWSFKVAGEKYGVYLRLKEGEGVWYAKRSGWEGKSMTIQAGDYEGMMIQTDPEVLENRQRSVCAQQ